MSVGWLVVLGLLLFGIVGFVYILLTDVRNYLRTRVPFVPTNKADVVDMIARVNILSTDFIFDLGSGNGKVLFTIEKLTGARTKGFERFGWAQNYAQLRKILSGSNTEFITDDFFKHTWDGATVVYAYLYPPLMRSIGEKFLSDCRIGSKLVCRDFQIPQLTANQFWQTPSGHKMFLYIR